MDKEYKGPERRRHKRFPFEYLTDYCIRFRWFDSKEFQTVYSGNISFGGVLLYSSNSCSINDPLEIEISYNDNNNKCIILLQGLVRWTEKVCDPQTGKKEYAVGAQFHNLSEEQENDLKEFLKKYIIRDNTELLEALG
ncbi:MAG: PilZ domain-containing protein [bacterium]